MQVNWFMKFYLTKGKKFNTFLPSDNLIGKAQDASLIIRLSSKILFVPININSIKFF